MISIEEDSGCWRPTNLPKSNGYVRVMIHGVSVSLHRFMAEMFNGPCPDGMVCDHVCRNRWCCNPGHIDYVTQRENVLRGEGPGRFARRTHCNNGHPYDDENTYLRPDGGRACRACQAAYTRAWRERRAS